MKTFAKLTLTLGLASLLFFTACSQKSNINPQRKNIIDAVFASGFIIDENEYSVTAATDAYIEKSFVKEGDLVAFSTQLFLLSHEVQSAQFRTAETNYADAKNRNDVNSPQVQQLVIQIEQAKSQFESDEINFNRYSNLIVTKAVSQVDYDKVKLQYGSSKRNLEIYQKALQDLQCSLKLNEQNASNQFDIQRRNEKDYFLSSNISGIVISVYKNQGDFVRRGEIIAKLGGGKPVIKLLIAEEDIKSIELGDKAVISLNTEKEKTYEAKVNKIYPGFDSKEQSFIVEATFTEVPKNLLYNIQLQANIIIAEKQNALIIPAKYLQSGNMVQLANGNKVPVKKGICNNDWVEILDGIAESEAIILPKSAK